MMTSAGFTTHISITFAIALAIAPTAALAGLKVSGDPGRVVVEAQNASIEEVFAALSQKFNLRYRSSANLQTQISGTYEGTLRYVVTRILTGRNFFINSNAGVMEVTVLEKAPTVSTKAQSPAAPQVNQSPQALSKLGEGRVPVPTPGSSASSLPPPEPGATSLAVPPPVPSNADPVSGLMPEPQPSNITVPRLLK
jgi:hypothetical protein